MVFHWSLRDSKSPQVSRTRLSILSDLNSAVVWMVSTRSLISETSSLLINYLVTVPRAPITIGINVIFMFHSFFNFQVMSRHSLLFTFFQFHSMVIRDSNIHNLASSFFLLISIRSSQG